MADAVVGNSVRSPSGTGPHVGKTGSTATGAVVELPEVGQVVKMGAGVGSTGAVVGNSVVGKSVGSAVQAASKPTLCIY